MDVTQQQVTVAPPQTRLQPAWVDWALSIGLLVLLAPVAIPLAILEVVMRGDEA